MERFWTQRNAIANSISTTQRLITVCDCVQHSLVNENAPEIPDRHWSSKQIVPITWLASPHSAHKKEVALRLRHCLPPSHRVFAIGSPKSPAPNHKWYWKTHVSAKSITIVNKNGPAGQQFIKKSNRIELLLVLSPAPHSMSIVGSETEIGVWTIDYTNGMPVVERQSDTNVTHSGAKWYRIHFKSYLIAADNFDFDFFFPPNSEWRFPFANAECEMPHIRPSHT